MLLLFPKRAPPSTQVKCKRIYIILLWSGLVGQLLFTDKNTTYYRYLHQHCRDINTSKNRYPGLSGYPASSLFCFFGGKHMLRKPAGRLGVVSPCERSENRGGVGERGC